MTWLCSAFQYILRLYFGLVFAETYFCTFVIYMNMYMPSAKIFRRYY